MRGTEIFNPAAMTLAWINKLSWGNRLKPGGTPESWLVLFKLFQQWGCKGGAELGNSNIPGRAAAK
jgi:hypothetical protein